MESESESGGCCACLIATYAFLTKPVITATILIIDAACGASIALALFGVAPIYSCGQKQQQCDIFFNDLGSRKGRNGIHVTLLLYFCFSITLLVPIVQLFGAMALQWAYTKATGLEFGGEYIATMIRDRIFQGMLAFLAGLMWTAVFWSFTLASDEDVLGLAWFGFLSAAILIGMANLLSWYRPWAPDGEPSATETERQPIMAAKQREDDDGSDEESSGWFSKRRTDKNIRSSDKSRRSSVDSQDSTAQPSRWKFW